MSSGRHFLSSLDRGMDVLRRDFRKLDNELQNITRGLAHVRRRETDAYRELARLRLSAIDAASFSDTLDAADRKARQILGERDTALADLGQTLDDVQAELDRLAGERTERADALETAEQAATDKLADVQAALAEDPAFIALRDKAQALVDQAAEAEEKTKRAEEDRREKGKPYEADPLFRYLWDRGYGTSAYRAWPLARLIDRMMARHIRFEKARRNYYTLTEIPKRLRSHTERLNAATVANLNEVSAHESAAEARAGIPALEERVEQAAAAVAATDAAIDSAETRYNETLAERERFANGTDRYFEEALSTLVASYEADPIPELRRLAERTAERSDDRLVQTLDELRDEARDLESHLGDKQEIHGRRMNRLNELTAVRNQYKRKNFDSIDSVIDDRGSAELMLTEFLSGLISGDRLWRVIRHSQRFRPRISHAPSGRIGRTRLPRMPRSVRLPRGGGFKVPRSRGGGGFRTKGGF